MRQIEKGTVDVSVVIRIVDSTDGTPETGVTAATGGLVLEYRRELEASVSLATIVDLAALTTAHTDKGIKHIGNGYYRLDLVDAACATGATGVLIHGTATGMVVIGEYVELVDMSLTGQSAIDLKDFADAGYDPDTNKVQGVVLVDTLTTYTGDTPQTGDSFARIGATGSGLTSLATQASVDAVKVDTAAILDDTDLIDDATSGLAKIALDVAAILVDTSTTLDGRIPAALVGGRMDATVDGDGMEAAAVTAIWTKAAVAPTAIPAATATMLDTMSWFLHLSITTHEVETGEHRVRNTADNATIATYAHSDAAGVFQSDTGV